MAVLQTARFFPVNWTKIKLIKINACCFADAGAIDDGEWSSANPRTTFHRPYGKNCSCFGYCAWFLVVLVSASLYVNIKPSFAAGFLNNWLWVPWEASSKNPRNTESINHHPPTWHQSLSPPPPTPPVKFSPNRSRHLFVLAVIRPGWQDRYVEGEYFLGVVFKKSPLKYIPVQIGEV